ncbi:carbonic anhydrase [Pontibacillus yanchengensis]|uniref:carbonic anhydrase n=2 Tax=Pontibacillus yanchengensis TaxID=462910 RepID=A0A6I4ZXX4_9BACI|nr:carbonic anhydrase [Pontibacillus yanchengensis]MYL35015.1 carbonic anhydrase [Pontibacillus yanchengensis]MYL55273.1 carbonic anhydrase [Pontibacillus yanchengensis]
MSVIDSMLEYNKKFVENKEYEKYITTKFPDKKIVILTCMDTRLLELLPRAMNLGNGDAKIIKNAGAIISHPFGSIMRSIIVALYELQADEVAVIGHYGCGMTGLKSEPIIDKALESGMDRSSLEALEYAGVDVEQWLKGFDDVEESVQNSVDLIRKHPFLPKNTPVHGLVISPETGELTVVDKQ